MRGADPVHTQSRCFLMSVVSLVFWIIPVSTADSVFVATFVRVIHPCPNSKRADQKWHLTRGTLPFSLSSLYPARMASEGDNSAVYVSPRSIYWKVDSFARKKRSEVVAVRFLYEYRPRFRRPFDFPWAGVFPAELLRSNTVVDRISSPASCTLWTKRSSLPTATGAGKRLPTRSAVCSYFGKRLLCSLQGGGIKVPQARTLTVMK